MAPYILGSALMLVLMVTLERRPPANVERYLWFVLAEIPFLWGAHYWLDDDSPQYAAIYCLFTSLILYAILRIAWDTLRQRQHRLRAVAVAFVFAATLTETAKLDMHGRWAWISLAEGFLLLLAGILTSMAGAYRPRWDLYVPLGVFWVLQGGYSLGWTIRGPFWQEWNWIVPPAMGLACFSYLALRLRPHGSMLPR